MRIKRVLKVAAYSAVGLFAVIQFVPYGCDQSNPATTREPQWDSSQTRELARRACFDCHSNETRWPWYSRVAPMRWLVSEHVAEGRGTINFSEWDRTQHDLDELAEVVLEGEMPPWDYQLLHPEAQLTDAEKQQLARGLTATVRSRVAPGDERDEDDD